MSTAYDFIPGPAPLLISMPHVGTELVPEVAAGLSEPAKGLCDTDWHLPVLYDFAGALGASLLIARGVGRQRELTLRTALGASRARLARLLFAESALIAAAGGLLGLLAASWGLAALVASMPEPPAYWASYDIDGRVLTFTLLISVLTAVACGSELRRSAKADRPGRRSRRSPRSECRARRPRWP